MQLNSKWIKTLNIRAYILDLIEQKMVNILELIGIVKDFLNSTPIAQALEQQLITGTS